MTSIRTLSTPPAPTRIAVAHQDIERTTTVAELNAGDIVVRVLPDHRYRGLAVNSQIRTINNVIGERDMAVEFLSARGVAVRLDPTRTVIVRRATAYEEV